MMLAAGALCEMLGERTMMSSSSSKQQPFVGGCDSGDFATRRGRSWPGEVAPGWKHHPRLDASWLELRC